MRAEAKWLPIEGEHKPGDMIYQTNKYGPPGRYIMFSEDTDVREGDTIKKVKLFAITQKGIKQSIPQKNIDGDELMWFDSPKGWFKILGELSPGSTLEMKEDDEIEIETDSTTGFIIFYGNKKYPHGRCSVHNKAEEGEYVKVRYPTRNTYR